MRSGVRIAAKRSIVLLLRVDLRATRSASRQAGLREDLAETIHVLERHRLREDPAHRHGGVELVGRPRNRSHRLHAAVAPAVDPDLATDDTAASAESRPPRPGPCAWPFSQSFDGEILERPAEARAAAIVDRQDDEAFRRQVLLDEVLAAHVGVRPAAVHLHQRRTSLPRIHLRRQIEESLHVQAVEALERNSPAARARPPSFVARLREPPLGPADGWQVIDVAALGLGGAREDEGVARGGRIEAAEHAAEIADARRRPALHGHRPDVMLAALLIDEIEPHGHRRTRTRGVRTP